MLCLTFTSYWLWSSSNFKMFNVSGFWDTQRRSQGMKERTLGGGYVRLVNVSYGLKYIYKIIMDPDMAKQGCSDGFLQCRAYKNRNKSTLNYSIKWLTLKLFLFYFVYSAAHYLLTFTTVSVLYTAIYIRLKSR